jgi:hypothetical protein
MKSWAEKLNSPKPHQVKPVPMNIAGMKEGQIMLIPTAKIVDAFIRAIPEGSSMDHRALRAALAERYDAEVTCPITTGIFLRIVAEAAWEAHENGAGIDEITPVWRVLDKNSPTVKKISFDPQFLFDQRQREGLSP